MKSLANPLVSDRRAVVVSAKGKILGRLASQVATILQGKDRPTFRPNLLSGRPVVVTQVKELVITGQKRSKKVYYRHSGYLGHLKETTLGQLMRRSPDKVLRLAVAGMLPKNRLRRRWLAALEIRPKE